MAAIEGFLARLASSDVRDRFVLKDGVLLAAFDSRRPTKDVDLAGLDLVNDTEAVRDLLRTVIGSAPLDGGWDRVRHRHALTAEVVRDEDDYPGVRVHIEARLASTKLAFHVDVNIGDPIWPAPTTVTIPRLRGGTPIELCGYPMHMVHAEKIVTAIQRGTANTRRRDFGDIWSLSRRHPVDASDLGRAIDQVAHHR